MYYQSIFPISFCVCCCVLARSLKVKRLKSVQSDRFFLAKVQVLDLDDLVLHFVATDDDCELGAKFLCSLWFISIVR